MRKLFFLSSLFVQMSYAQDPYFVQAHNNAMYLNPALTGCFISPSISLSDRLDLTRPNTTYNTFSASYHQLVRLLHGGLGLYYINDNSSDRTLITNRINLSYAAHLDINDKLTLRLGITGGYEKRTIDWDKLTFGDMIDPRYGFIYPTTEERPPSSRNIFDYGIGLFAYTRTLYAGGAIDHLNEPEESFIKPSTGSRLPRKLTINMGLNLPVGDSANNISINPDVLYLSQRSFNETILSVTARIKYLLIGTGIRIDNGLIFSIGFENKLFRFTYCYDHPSAGFGKINTGSHEFFLGFKIYGIHPDKGKWRPVNLVSI